MDKVQEPTPQELCDILDTLQDRLEETPYPDEATVLKGSYGVYLHSLKHHDPSTAEIYVGWMRDYNQRYNHE
jgi:hypothetical protein